MYFSVPYYRVSPDRRFKLNRPKRFNIAPFIPTRDCWQKLTLLLKHYSALSDADNARLLDVPKAVIVANLASLRKAKNDDDDDAAGGAVPA
jgi:hypothetical protein